MRHLTPRLSLIALIGTALVAFIGFAHGDEELLPRAAAQFREKAYSESFNLARKSDPSPQRSFLMGMDALRMGKPEEAVPLLAEAEQRLPLVGDYAALYQAEALLELKKYNEAAAKAIAIPKAYPASLLIRRSGKLYLDILIASADYKSAIKVGQAFVEKYPSGGDSVDALFQLARSCEETGDLNGAVQIYRSIYLNNPLASQAKKSRERLKVLEKGARELHERLLALAVVLRGLAHAAPKAATTHAALAGALELARAAVGELEPAWAALGGDEWARWQRDRPLLQVAGKARAARRDRAWAILDGTPAATAG